MVLGIYLILKEIGVDVTPIVAGAGIFALAIGFGAQNLVKDIVAGFFIIFEDQYNVGDYVTIEGISGTIEEISIRITKIRDLSGILHIIPNGAITRTSNFSKDFSVSRFEVSVAYESDFDHAIAVLEKTASELCMDWSLFIIEPTQVLGIVSLGESEVVIRTQTKLTVGKKVDFECELRKRILKQFRENNIEIPYKRLVVLSDKEDGGVSGL
jgi:small conductance mechanosensitive channel